MHIKSILIAFKAAPVKSGEISIVPQSYCLVLLRTCRVPERNVYSHKSLPRNSCSMKSKLVRILNISGNSVFNNHKLRLHVVSVSRQR
jgi:hypothetical protein